MRLSAREIAQAEKYISHFETNARHWGWARWLLLSAAFAMLMSLSWHTHKAKEAHDLNQNGGFLVELDPDLEIVEKYLDVKIGLLRSEFDHSLMAVLTALLGGPLLGAAIARWGRSRRDQLAAKCMRIVLESTHESSPSNKSFKSDTGDAGAS